MDFVSISEKYPKARKEYTCIWCGELILVGEKHLSSFYKFQGDLNADRHHLECEDAMKSMDIYELEEGFEPYSFKKGTRDEK
jgi:hypothetical protein